MAKEKIEFDVTQLSDADWKFYSGLSEKDKSAYRKNWCAVEEQKRKLKQTQARMSKMKNAQKEKERKARTHHLIEVGGIVEKYVEIKDLDAFEGYIKQWTKAIEKTQAPHEMPEPTYTGYSESDY